MFLPVFHRRAALLLLLALSACSKKEDSPPVQPLGDSMNWTVDGAAVKTTEVNIFFSGSIGTLTRATITGINASDGTDVRLELPIPYTVGTYTLVPGGGQASAVYHGQKDSQGARPTYAGHSGTIIISSVANSTIVGTFAFTAECESSVCLQGSTKAVTSGSFRFPD